MSFVAYDETRIVSHSTANTDAMAERCCRMILDIQRTEDERKLADSGGLAMNSYHHDVKQFVAYIRETEQPLVEGLQRWISELKTKYKARTVNRKLAAVRARILGSRTSHGVLDMLGDEIHPSMRTRIESSLRKIKGMKVNTNVVRSTRIANYQHEIPMLLDGINDVAVKLVVEFMSHTACRISETLGVELRNIEREGSHCRVTITGKGNKERDVFIPSELYRRIVKQLGSERWLFEHTWYGKRKPYNARSMTTRIGDWTEHILGRRLSAHALRHSCLTHLYVDQGVDIKTVSQFAGHASVSTTLDFYTHTGVTAERVAVSIGGTE